MSSLSIPDDKGAADGETGCMVCGDRHCGEELDRTRDDMSDMGACGAGKPGI